MGPFFYDPMHLAILGAVLTLLGKIVWDWLVNRGQKKNGEHLERRFDHINMILAELNERQKKLWEHILQKKS